MLLVERLVAYIALYAHEVGFEVLFKTVTMLGAPTDVVTIPANGSAAGSGAAGARDLMSTARRQNTLSTKPLVAETHSEAWLDTCYQRAAGSGEWKSLSRLMYHAVQTELGRRHVDHFSVLSPAEQASIVETVYSNMMAAPSKVSRCCKLLPSPISSSCAHQQCTPIHVAMAGVA